MCDNQKYNLNIPPKTQWIHLWGSKNPDMGKIPNWKKRVVWPSLAPSDLIWVTLGQGTYCTYSHFDRKIYVGLLKRLVGGDPAHQAALCDMAGHSMLRLE